MVVIIPAIGLLLWISFLLAVMVLCGIVWAVSTVALWLMDPKPRLNKRKGRPNAPPPKPAVGPAPAVGTTRSAPGVPKRPAAEAQVASEIWPKWNVSHRRDVDREKSLWQEQFDALNSRK